MQTSGLVVMLAADAQEPARALEWLRSHPELEVGEPTSAGQVPVVLETPSGEISDRFTRELARHPGIARVEVVFVGFAPDSTDKSKEQDHVLGSS